jgi:para-aminobenzoate synthetase / 4-amino-4-deoxychorismate lyase
MRKIPLKDFLDDLSGEKVFVFCDTKQRDKDNRLSYLFTRPEEIISCNNLTHVIPSINQIESRLKSGMFAAGFISYEAGFAFEKAFSINKPFNFPLLWFGIFNKPDIFDHKYLEFEDVAGDTGCAISNVKADISRSQYVSSIRRIKKYIEKGSTYQVNRTFKLRFSFNTTAEDLYLYLRKKQTVSYSALIKNETGYVLSFSPELFFRKTGSIMRVKPMKGTMRRGCSVNGDTENARLLYNCQKNRSENIMIVDLMRNDLGRISDIGSVKTKKYFTVEKYESLFQMTSTVESSLKDGIRLADMFKALFPSGSVTGAPKISTMRIINEIEKTPRGIYTGSIGFITPDMDSVFNIAIRTISLNMKGKKGEMGVGSGIVYDSDPDKEFNECILKADFLTKESGDFKLIETMLWSPCRGCELLNSHMQRLKESADYFSIKYDKDRLLGELNNTFCSLKNKVDYRIRLLMDRRGDVEIIALPVEGVICSGLVTVSAKNTCSSDKWLYHKTTERSIYDSEYICGKKRGFFDVIFRNERGEITEGAISNIFIRKNNIYYTPPLKCGVLNGVFRRHIIAKNILRVKENVLYYEDLLQAEEIIMTNAVRGMVRVSLVKEKARV